MRNRSCEYCNDSHCHNAFESSSINLLTRWFVAGGRWGEVTDAFNIDSKVWFRTSAFAERYWSANASIAADVKPYPASWSSPTINARLVKHRCRLLQRGIDAQAYHSILLPERGRWTQCELWQPPNRTTYKSDDVLYAKSDDVDSDRAGPKCKAIPHEPALTCPSGAECCRQRFWGGGNKCSTGLNCNVCAECCHDEIGRNQSTCDKCFHTQCKPGTFGNAGCKKGGKCCRGGNPGVSSTLPNCLLVGDSVAHGTYGLVKEMLKDKCAVSNIEGVEASGEDACFWSMTTDAATGLPVKWAVIHFNEGLHSLWPRVNTSDELKAYAANLGRFTDTLKSTGAKLIYATMTPYMPEKYLNPSRPNDPVLDPRNDVETKNALAVKTVKAHGVTAIDDLYTAVTDVCGKVYRNCSLCDDESSGHPQGACGFHYSPAGWQLLANQTASFIAAALTKELGQPAPWAIDE